MTSPAIDTKGVVLQKLSSHALAQAKVTARMSGELALIRNVQGTTKLDRDIRQPAGRHDWRAILKNNEQDPGGTAAASPSGASVTDTVGAIQLRLHCLR